LNYPVNKQTDKHTAVKTVSPPKVAGVELRLALLLRVGSNVILTAHDWQQDMNDVHRAVWSSINYRCQI